MDVDQLGLTSRLPLTAAVLEVFSGLLILSTLGWGFDFERCVRCGKECPAGQVALVDTQHGGLVCRSCGGARLRLDGPTREWLARAAASGDPAGLESTDTDVALTLVEGVLKAHAGLE